MKFLKETVYPSSEESILAYRPNDEYGGAHDYALKACYGYVDGETEYSNWMVNIPFVKVELDGEVRPGVQSEQLLIMLKDRHEKLNARFPSPFHDEFMQGIEMALEACRKRIDDRKNRGVMGKLEK